MIWFSKFFSKSYHHTLSHFFMALKVRRNTMSNGYLIIVTVLLHYIFNLANTSDFFSLLGQNWEQSLLSFYSKLFCQACLNVVICFSLSSLTKEIYFSESNSLCHFKIILSCNKKNQNRTFMRLLLKNIIYKKKQYTNLQKSACYTAQNWKTWPARQSV